MTPTFNNLNTPFLENLTAVGFAPEAVDLVVCTHLHMDHVGWNTVLVDGHWVPTFPRARYVMTRADVEHWQQADAWVNAFATSVQPLLDHGVVDAVESTHRVSASVSLTPTPGHTPGHASVRIDSKGSHAVITGDMVHSPVQLVRPEWSSVADSDAEEATRSRHTMREYAGRAT